MSLSPARCFGGRRFDAIRALIDVDLSFEPGEALGLMIDHGAGKSTLARVIAGSCPPSFSEMRFGGEVMHFHMPVESRKKGIEVVYQDLALCNNLSAAANVFLGQELKRRIGPCKFLDHATMARRAGELFEELKSETRPCHLVRQMSGGQRRTVAIARTRLSNARMVLMDEPTAAISVRQVAEATSPLAMRS